MEKTLRAGEPGARAPQAVILLAALLAGCATAPSASPATFESIEADYTNLRGLNYIPSYAGSSVGAWSNYDRALVERELRNTRNLGANSIRVWLSYWSWKHEPAKFVSHFRHLLETCEEIGLYVMPILWDSCFSVNPNSDTPWLDFDRWTPNPGPEWILQEDAWPRFDAYVESIVSAGKTSPALLIWDVMNEPSGEGIDPWLVHHVKRVRKLDPDHPVTIGWAFTPRASEAAAMVDVVSYHPYGIFRENVRHFTKLARDFSKRHGNLPIIATEAGAPGAAARYEDVMRFLEEERVGFMLFEAVIHTHRKYPYSLMNGFLFSDGETRDADGVRAFRELAKRQGGVVGKVPAVKRTDHPAYAPYHPVPYGFGVEDLLDLLNNWDERYGTERYKPVEASTVAFYTAALNWTFISLAWLDVLKPDEVALATGRREDFTRAVREGNRELAERNMKKLVELALRVIDRAKIGPQS